MRYCPSALKCPWSVNVRPLSSARTVDPPTMTRLCSASSCIRISAVCAAASKIFTRSLRPILTARADTVETLGPSAGIVVQLEPLVAADSQPVRDLSRLHGLGIVALASIGDCGSSNSWSRSVTFPERSSCVFSHSNTRSCACDPPRSKTKVPALELACGPSATTSDMAVGFVLEEVVDPFLLHQPADEVEVGLVVLDAVVAREVDALELERCFDGRGLENPPDDLGHGHALEDAGVRRPRQEPEPRDDLGVIRGARRVAVARAEAGDDSVEVALGRAERERDGDRLTDDLLERDRALGR